MSKRHSQDTAVNRPGRVTHDGAVVYCCHHCGRFLLTLCQETGNRIEYPISGPIDTSCPMPVAGREGNADDVETKAAAPKERGRKQKRTGFSETPGPRKTGARGTFRTGAKP